MGAIATEPTIDASGANEPIAAKLEQVAALLEEQGANQYRVRAWRMAAETVRALERPVTEILREEGAEGIDRLPGIGPVLVRAIREIVERGRLGMLDRLRGHAEPLSVLATVPGVGEVLAERLHTALGIESLEELEQAAREGRLAAVSGFGPKRIAGISDALATRLRTRRQQLPPVAQSPVLELPQVSELLDVDREYRNGAAAGTLPLITPRRFNPSRERWLPVLHCTRGARHYTVLYSNTELAHRVGRTHDWVVIFFDGGDAEHRATIVTALKGVLAGRRVVRGREQECIAHYKLSTAA